MIYPPSSNVFKYLNEMKESAIYDMKAIIYCEVHNTQKQPACFTSFSNVRC